MKSVTLFSACSLLASLSASAQSISINLGSNESGSEITEAGKVSGAIPIAGDLWNNAAGANGNLSNLIDSTGSSTSASVTWTSGGTWRSGSTGATATSENGDLTKGYLDDGGSGPVVTVNSPYLTSDVYVVVASDAGNPYTASPFSVNGVFYKGDGAGGTSVASGSGDSWSGQGWVDADTLIEGGSYLKIEDQAAIVISGLNSSPGRASIAGVQIANSYAGTLSYWDTNGATAGAGGATPSGNWSDGNWSTSDLGTNATSNWTAGHAAVFSAGSDATGAYTVTLGGVESADAIWVQNGDVTLSGGTLALGSTGLLRSDGTGLTVDSILTATDLTMTGNVSLNNAANAITGLVTVSGATTLGADQSWNRLSGAGAIDIGADTLSVGDSTNSSFAGTFAGSGAINKTGSGSLTLTNTSTGFTGAATLNDGTLVLDTSAASQNLNWNISGAGDLAKRGGNQLTILSDVTNTGSLTIEGGTLQVGNVGTAGSFGGQSSVILQGNALLRYRLSGADATLSSDVTFGSNNSEIRQHGGTDADKLTITGTVGANTSDGILSVNGGDMVLASGAVVNVRDVNLVGPTAGDRGTLIVEAGATLDAGYLNIGNGSGQSGIINQTGGTVTMASGGTGVRIGHWDNGSDAQGSEYNISGGTFDASASRVSVGWDGKGTLNISGTGLVQAGRLDVDENGADRPGIVNLNGGRLEIGTGGITFDGTAGSALNLGGGTLAGVGNSNWGALINANTGTSSTIEVGSGITATQTNVVQGDGDISKTGTGTLVLNNAANTHSGGLNIDAGTLYLNGTTASAVAVNSGGTLRSGNVGTAGPGTVGALTLNNGSSSTFRLGTTSDQINITGTNGLTVTAGATHTAAIVPAGQLNVNDEFVLFDYDGTVQGDGVSGITASLPNPHYGFSVNDDLVNTQIKLKIDSIDAVIWTGSAGSTWDVENTTNWKTESDLNPSNFYAFDVVKFDDTASTGAVNLSGTITPATTSINNSSLAYTFSGAGISGAGGLTKSGDGTVILTNSNSYTGVTDIQEGSLQIGDGGTTGGLTGSGSISIAAGAELVTNRSDAHSLARASTGAGTLVKNGSGDLTITASNNSVDMVVNAGTLLARGGGFSTAFAAGKLITVNSGATLDTTTHSMGSSVGGGGDVPDVFLNSGTWQLNNEQYIGVLTMTEGLTTGPGEIRTLSGGDFTVNATAGGSEMAARINMVSGKTFAVADGGAASDLLVSGNIVGSGVITKNGAGRMVLSGTNTNAGDIIVAEGRLALSGDNSGRTGGYEVTGGILEATAMTNAAIGTSFIALKDGTLEYNGTGAETTTRALWIDGGGQSGTFNVTNGSANLTMAPGAGTVNQQVIKTGAGTLTMQGVISGGGAVTVNQGTMVLDAVHTYTGDTSVNSGKLTLAAGASIDNSANIILNTSTILDVSAVAGYTVADGQTLSGSGTVTGDLIVVGAMAPGSPSGTMTIDGNLTFEGASLLEIEVAGNLVSQYDRVNVIGDFAANGSITVELTGYNPILGDSFDLVDWTGTASGSPSFDFTNAPLDSGLVWNTDNFLIDGSLQVGVPEPSTVLLVGFAALGMTARRRRK